MRIVSTVLLTVVWLAAMQANLGWLGSESARLQVRLGIPAGEAWRRTLRRTILFAGLITGLTAYIGWRIWR